ncbi:RNA polymerase sigma factor [Evansella sp. AB-P1]|uniref:RNA polymerase sigma factor n=1 Tax=Evansella sp. AB-P1 TaxID=3037653 RepID=UPI00241E1742|nr:RNA polymerase sigma factor [Evansella sp. AB-P1]MDG5788600.1 RNA polymerase sigma factor [Evansella sp. AB-P1]
MKKSLSLEQIYSLYMQDVYRYIFSLCKNKALSEDIVQETFYRAYFYVEEFDQEKVKPWLFKVAYHTFIDFIRKEKRITYFDDLTPLDSKIEKQVNSAEHDYMVKNRIETWFNMMEELPVSKKKVLILRDYYNFSYQEIADILDMSLSKVKITLFRGRKELHIKLGDLE